jgi:hypothetical protein
VSDCSTPGCLAPAQFGARALDARPPTGDRLVCRSCLLDHVLEAPRSDTPEPSWIVWRLAEELLGFEDEPTQVATPRAITKRNLSDPT